MTDDMNSSSDFVSEEDYLDYLKTYFLDKIEENSQELLNIINIVSKAMIVSEVNGVVAARCELNNEELQVLAMKIPAICTFLQSTISSMSIYTALDDVMMGIRVSQELNVMNGSKAAGTATERAKKAELTVSDEKLKNAASKQYIKAVQDLITRADKVYEGIKKTMDYRAREMYFDEKNTGA